MDASLDLLSVCCAQSDVICSVATAQNKLAIGWFYDTVGRADIGVQRNVAVVIGVNAVIVVFDIVVVIADIVFVVVVGKSAVDVAVIAATAVVVAFAVDDVDFAHYFDDVVVA